MIIYLDKDPQSYYGGYPDASVHGYTRPGWYIWGHAGVRGPFSTEQEATNEQSRIKNKENNNE